jgi:hypothetical protein
MRTRYFKSSRGQRANTLLIGLKHRIQTRFRTSLSQLFYKRALRINSRVPIISFTFDDFPRSALLVGGAILNNYGLKGTFYGSLGLMGEETAVGAIFCSTDLLSLLSQGHELGCHTHGHLNPWRTTPAQFEESIIKNAIAADELIPGFAFRSFSYPLFYPLPQIKYKVAKHFSCCRGGGQKLNANVVDLNLLHAFFLERSRKNPDQVKSLIDQNCRARGWLIFATHDISHNPSPYGCEPTFFEDIVQYSVRSGSIILPVIQAYETLRTSRPRRV